MWNPRKVIVRGLQALQASVAKQIRQASPPIEHRGSAQGGATGGSLADAVMDPSLIVEKGWPGGVLKLSAVGQKLLWFVRGTKRQKPRPIDTARKEHVAVLVEELESDAVAYFERRCA